MKISQECKEYEVHARRTRAKAPFPIEPNELVTYIKYRARCSTFCKYLSNLERHPLHGTIWLNAMNNNETVRNEMKRSLEFWKMDLKDIKLALIGVDNPHLESARSLSKYKQQQQQRAMLPPSPPYTFVLSQEPRSRGKRKSFTWFLFILKLWKIKLGVMIVNPNSSNFVVDLGIGQQQQRTINHASLLPVMSGIVSLEEEPVKIAKNPITNYFNIIKPTPLKEKSNTTPSLSSSSTFKLLNKAYQPLLPSEASSSSSSSKHYSSSNSSPRNLSSASSSFNPPQSTARPIPPPQQQHQRPMPQKIYVKSSEIFETPLSDEEGYEEPVIVIQKENKKKRKRKMTTMIDRKGKRPMCSETSLFDTSPSSPTSSSIPNSLQILIETLDPGRTEDNLINHVKMEHINNIGHVDNHKSSNWIGLDGNDLYDADDNWNANHGEPSGSGNSSSSNSSSNSINNKNKASGSSGNLKRVPMVLAAPDNDTDEEEEETATAATANIMVSQLSYTNNSSKFNLFSSQPNISQSISHTISPISITPQEEDDEEEKDIKEKRHKGRIDFDRDSSFMEYKNGFVGEEKEIKIENEVEFTIEDQLEEGEKEEFDFPDNDNVYEEEDDFFKNHGVAREEVDAVAEEEDIFEYQHFDFHGGEDDDSNYYNNTSNSNNNNDNQEEQKKDEDDEEVQEVLDIKRSIQEEEQDIFAPFYDREFDQDVYEAYLEIIDRQEQLSLERGTRIVEPNLMVLSHIAIEDHFVEKY